MLFGLNTGSTLGVGIAGYLQASVQGQFVKGVASVFRRREDSQSVSGQGCFSLINESGFPVHGESGDIAIWRVSCNLCHT
jgi:hypothetical protein